MMTGMVNIGQVTKAHGIKGEVFVLPLTDFPERFSRLTRVFASSGDMRRELHISQAQPVHNGIIVKFAEVGNRSEAEALKWWYIQIPAEEVVPLPEGHYYFFQIIGLKVYDLEGKFLGTVVEVQRTGANDVYWVRKPGSDKQFGIPGLKSVVREIDVVGGKMLVDLPPGL